MILILPPDSSSLSGSLKRLGLLGLGLQDIGQHAVILLREGSPLVEFCREKSIEFITYGDPGYKKPVTRLLKCRWLCSLVFTDGERGALMDAIEALPEKPELIIARNAIGVLRISHAAKKYNIPIVWDIGIETRQPLRSLVFMVAGLYSSLIVMQSNAQAEELFPWVLKKMFHRKTTSLIPGIQKPTIDKPLPLFEVCRPASILCAASITPRKNQEVLIQAVLQMLDKHKSFSEVHVLFAGQVESLDYKEKLEKIISRLPGSVKCFFYGFVSNVYELILKSDVVVLSSKDEGVPNIVQEAMWLRKPVIAPAVGGVPEMVKSGETGWCIPPRDIEGFADALYLALSEKNLAGMISSNAMHYAENNFSYLVWAKKYHKIIDDRLMSPKKNEGGQAC